MKGLIKILPAAFLLLATLSAPPAHAAAPVITNIVTVPLLTIQSDLYTTNLIQFVTNVDQTNWVTLTNITVMQSPYLFVDVTATGPHRFYRVVGINPPPATHFTLTGLLSPETAGSGGSVFVTAKDASGAVVPSYTGTVHFTSTDGQATLAADYTFTAGDAGTHPFLVDLKTSGIQSVTATDTLNPSITGVQGGIIVNPGTTLALTVSGLTSPRTAGVAGNVTVTARDFYGNTTYTYAGTIHFTSADGQAVLPANYTFTGGDGGVHTFTSGVTLKTAGVQTVTATDVTFSSITGVQGSIIVNPAATSALVVSGFPTAQTSGVSGNFTVSARDAFANTTPGYGGTVHITSTDGQAVLPSNYTFTGGDAGAHTFSATLKTTGTQAITATDTASSSITGSQTNITITP